MTDVYSGVNTEEGGIDSEKCAQIGIATEKFVTKGWPQIVIESRPAMHFVYFLFSHYYVHIMLVIWSEHRNCVCW